MQELALGTKPRLDGEKDVQNTDGARVHPVNAAVCGLGEAMFATID